MICFAHKKLRQSKLQQPFLLPLLGEKPNSFPKVKPPVNIGHFEERIAKIYDHLYANSECKTPRAIAQEFQKLLQIAIFLEKKVNPTSPAFSFQNGEKRTLLSNQNSCRSFATFVRTTFQKMNEIEKYYEKGTSILLGDFDICFSCLQLNDLFISDPSRDIFGDAVELFRSYWSKSHGGQFFTDSRVTSLAISLLGFDPFKGEPLIDICSGTGGFLLAAVNSFYRSKKFVSLSSKDQIELIKKLVVGQEVDEDVSEIGNAALSSRVGASISLIKKGNSLQRSSFNNGSGIFLGRHKFAATNPPFGTKITIKDPALLIDFSISKASRSASDCKPCAPDILFIERNLDILADGGLLAIVLPYQILSGPQTLWVRKWLFEKALLKAVIDLPSDTFQPYTGTKASLVLLEKLSSKASFAVSNDVFMACPKHIGHDRRGNPIYEKSLEGVASEKIKTDFPQVEEAFTSFLKGKDPSKVFDLAFKVNYRAITSQSDLRFDAKYHFPNNDYSFNLRTKRASFKTRKLRDCVSDIFYPGRFKRNYTDSNNGVPFLGGTNISQFHLTGIKYFSKDDPHLHQLLVKEGWILVTRSGSTGVVSLVPKFWSSYAFSEHVIRIVPNPKVCSPEFVYASLRSKYGQDYLAKGVYGSVIDEISPDYIGDFDLVIPNDKNVFNRIVKNVQNGELYRHRSLDAYFHASKEFDFFIGNYLVNEK